MYKNKSIAVVVPAHNEQLLIGKVIEGCPPIVDHIVIVNDVSTDRTAEVVEEYARKDRRVVLINHPTNQGVGGAIATGYIWARDQAVDITVVMAGDNQMDPADLPAILDPVADGEVDYSKGNRLFTGQAWKTIPRVRYIGNSILSLLTKIASGYWHLADSQTGYTAISLKALKTLELENIYKRYGMPNDMLVKLNVFDFKVRDVPIRPVYNIGEKSGIKIRKVIFTISFLLVRLFLFRLKEKYIIRNFHPLVFFYAFSFFLFLLVLPMAGWALYWLIRSGGDISIVRFSLMAAAFTSMTAFQSLFFAMWMDMDTNKHLR